MERRPAAISAHLQRVVEAAEFITLSIIYHSRQLLCLTQEAAAACWLKILSVRSLLIQCDAETYGIKIGGSWEEKKLKTMPKDEGFFHFCSRFNDKENTMKIFKNVAIQNVN